MAAIKTTKSPPVADFETFKRIERNECRTDDKKQESSAIDESKRARRNMRPTYRLSYLKSQKLNSRLEQNSEHNLNGADSRQQSKISTGHEFAQASRVPPPEPSDIMRLNQADNLIRCLHVVCQPLPHTFVTRNRAKDTDGDNDRADQKQVRKLRRQKLHLPNSSNSSSSNDSITSKFEFTSEKKIQKTPPWLGIDNEKRARNYANASIQVPTVLTCGKLIEESNPDDAASEKIATNRRERCHQHRSSLPSPKQLEPARFWRAGALTLLAVASLCAAAIAAVLTGPRVVDALQNDPRPTIYSGQVSFGLLLSAHSSPGSDLTSAAAAAASSIDYQFESVTAASEQQMSAINNQSDPALVLSSPAPLFKTTTLGEQFGNSAAAAAAASARQTAARDNQSLSFENDELLAIASDSYEQTAETRHGRRQIFERPSHQMRRQQQHQQQNHHQQQHQVVASKQHQVESDCSQANPSALYAGMSAIWASHQANLVGDSQLAIGTYVYDSCNDLEVGQRQSVRIVSNLNAFQQTTCESPRGSPISLTIAHGDNQLRAIQLLTSFKVPVITTREHFALEDYHLLTRDQRRYLFSTAPSSRHLAVGALKYTKRVVSRTVASPKLPNQHHRMSSKNGLIVISRNLPAKFITYLTETIPNHVNYEMLHSDQPIDQVRSVEVLESILMLNKQHSSSSSSSSSSTLGSGTSSSPGGATSASESRLSLVKLNAPDRERQLRGRRSLTSDDSEAGGSGSATGGGDQDDSTSSGDQASDSVQQLRMLSPTILMFITPSEAIDLVTRLRNDLAEVSRYYSLVVATREDISPALRTIFHRGGSRLCAGKAFYTISPQPDEVHEFSRYFRDTVQMEGQSSDHPLICEFAKHQSLSRGGGGGGVTDLDDISAEAVIKAVWSAAAAFKLVHKRECGTGSAQDGPSDDTAPAASTHARYAKSQHHKQGRRQSLAAGNQTLGANKAPSGGQSECMSKMNKNMSNLVQRALRKLDVTINSTGLQALDGFRIKFDDSNELLTSKFSIKYINRECEITELGEYSGAKDSQLHLDEDTLAKSLESTVPDPWPIMAAKATATSNKQAATSGASRSLGLSTGGLSLDSPSTIGEDGATSGGADSNSGQSNELSAAAGSSEDAPRVRGSDNDEHDSTSGETDKLPTITLESDSPKRRRSNSPGGKLSKRKIQLDGASVSPVAPTTFAPTTTPSSVSSSRGSTESTGQPISIGADVPTSAQITPTTNTTTSTRRLTTNGPSLPALMLASGPPPADESSPKPMRELKPFPDGSPGAALKEWLPKSSAAAPQKRRHEEAAAAVAATAVGETMQTTSTTQAPIYSTLPESGGNTDLEMPAYRASGARTPAAADRVRTSLVSAASALTETSAALADYVTLPSIVRQVTEIEQSPSGTQVNATHRSSVLSMSDDQRPDLAHLRDLSVSPVPLSYTAHAAKSANDNHHQHAHVHAHHQQPQQPAAKEAQQSSRSRSRSHLKWIYSSWFTLTILGANICGALLTLYVLTFLLMKNCDGSLDRENQGTRSMHLLAIIVVFFGSTLFIVYPTPSLCLLRTSWHNFALVLVFGSLLLQTMQTRSISSLGLGGRPNRLNQFITLLFMVGVQVSFELQRWKYESANYVNFVNQYFSSHENDGDKKLIIFGNSISGQFNPLNSFNDQVTPVSIQLSEKYHSLLHDYCTQSVEDYLESQIYLWLILALLILFSITSRQHQRRGVGSTNGLLMTTSGGRVKRGGKSLLPPLGTPTYNLTSGKLLASQHETNEFLPHSQAFCGNGGGGGGGGGIPFSRTATAAAERLGLASAKGGRWNSVSQLGNVFVVTLISAPIYLFSVIMYVHGQELASPDLVASVSMVLIAFVVLIGTFIPLMRNYHNFDDLKTGTTASGGASDHLGGSNSAASLSRPIMSHRHEFANGLTSGDKRALRRSLDQTTSHQSSPNGAFLMFPEFASTGLRRPSSMGGESNSGATRRPFAETKESRRNMGLSLANLPEPLAAADSLRSLCVHNHRAQNVHQHPPPVDYGDDPQANLNSSPSGQHHQRPASSHHLTHRGNGGGSSNVQQRHRNSHGYAGGHSSRRSSVASSNGEKRLIMLDVDPCCPRHGLVATTNNSVAGGCGG